MESLTTSLIILILSIGYVVFYLDSDKIGKIYGFLLILFMTISILSLISSFYFGYEIMIDDVTETKIVAILSFLTTIICFVSVYSVMKKSANFSS